MVVVGEGAGQGRGAEPAASPVWEGRSLTTSRSRYVFEVYVKSGKK